MVATWSMLTPSSIIGFKRRNNCPNVRAETRPAPIRMLPGPAILLLHLQDGQRSMVVTTFDNQLARLKDDLSTQGNRVVEVTLRAVESYFERDQAKASSVVNGDSVIDRVDVQIERA